MGKAPAFQFYVKDWLSDPQLKQTSFSTKGIWIDILCFMWDAPERGKLESTVDRLCKMVGARKSEFELFVTEATELRFCDICVTNNGLSQDITVVNRRMNRAAKDKENNRLRQQKYRERHQGNAEITPPSPTPSPSPKKSSASAPQKLDKESLNESSIPKIGKDLNEVCKSLYEKNIFPDVHKFKNTMLKRKVNQRTILHALTRCHVKRKFDESGPWGYCTEIIKVEDGNYNEREYQKDKGLGKEDA